MNIKKELYKTTDLYLAALLRAKDIKLIKAIKEGNKFIFCFKDDGTIQKLIANYYSSSEMVSASKLIDSIKNLKAFTYNIK